MRTALQTKPRALVFLKRWWMVLLLPLSLLLVFISRQSAMLTERLYSGSIYPVLAGCIGGMTSLLPFSLLEFGILALILAVIAGITYVVVRTVRVRRYTLAPPKSDWKRQAECLVKLVSCIFFAFVMLCGLNYYRPEFTAFSGLTIRDSSTKELVALCLELTERANALYPLQTVDAHGVTRLTQEFGATARDARDAFGGLSQRYAVLPDLPITPKPILNSWWMSTIQITGVFSPYTYEANINTKAPPYTIPATMCHELAHTRGFMREDEANFIGYLACNESGDPAFEYSGVMLALVHASNRLGDVDYNAFVQVRERFSQGVNIDFAYNNIYWAQHEGPVAELSDAVNNTYLRMNNQTDGVQSYGRMVDLLLADYRARHGVA